MDNCKELSNDDSITEHGNNNPQTSEIPLPNDLIVEIIFKYIPLCLWSSRLELISKQFQECVFSAYRQLRTVNIQNLLLTDFDESIGQLPNCYHPKSSRWLKDILDKLLAFCPNLIELTNFECVSHTLNAEHFDTLKKFDKLQSISLTKLTDLNRQDVANFCSNCEDLKILYIGDVDTMRELSRYNIEVKKNVTTITLKSYGWFLHCENVCENLTTLKLGSLDSLFKKLVYDGKVMKSFQNLTSLATRLQSKYEFRVFLEMLPNLPKLTCLGLQVSFHTHYVPRKFETDLVCALNSLQNQLESFEFKQINNSCGELEVLQTFLFTKCYHLINLQLNLLTISTSIKEITRLSGSLQKFRLKSMGKSTIVFSSILMQLSNLTHLCLNYDCTGAVSDKTWEDLYILEQLRHLQIPGVFITDAVLKVWDLKGNKMFEKLVTLDIADCKEVTDLGACLLAKKAINLKVLNLIESKISDLTIIALANSAKKLKIGNFWQSQTLIGEDAVLDLIEKAVYLKHLHLHQAVVLALRENNGYLPYAHDVRLTWCGFQRYMGSPFKEK